MSGQGGSALSVRALRGLARLERRRAQDTIDAPSRQQQGSIS